tara:strand:+ start:3600 stop:3749 length:150 start_codon:yes stop_codon:yes gene_type:complete
MTEPEFNGLSVRVPFGDFKYMLQKLWQCRKSDPKCNDLYEKYKEMDFAD